ncbi:mitochondrial import inner membrane translocase subunit TIM44-2-like [Hibiscus syriacus]|uniref:mitochondrial import inner membrane translocase subunit TIM44-2-like n=1 Tax=Hibiscus syriacus TaxID=106335 RepID=UPI001923DE11|nr:mitochondrial import inner membrane translocase subunit TIM44-2-like [Hibiscus syriacus]
MAKANVEKVKRLRAWVQNYDWGRCGTEAQVARLLALNSGSEIKPERPYAEFWMGTHDSGPSFMADGNGEGRNLGLKDWILKNSNMLGHKVLKKWGSDLSFLFKYKQEYLSRNRCCSIVQRNTPTRSVWSFSLSEFVAEVQEAIRPVLNAYIKGDVETLKKYCSPEVIDRCKAEHTAYQSHGIFFDNKILHISDVEVRETKMMGTSPIIIVAFQTQQIHCIRDR